MRTPHFRGNARKNAVLLRFNLIFYIYFFFYFFFYLYLGKKKGCGEEEGGGTQMFHALVLAVKILHFAMLSTLQNKPFRSAISNSVFRRLFYKMFKRLSLRYSRKMAKT